MGFEPKSLISEVHALSHIPSSGLPHSILALDPLISYSMCLCLPWTMAFTSLVNGDHMLYLSSMEQSMQQVPSIYEWM